jgi:hypothetical protein
MEALLLVTFINVAILGLNLKLYTEILKDHSQNRRVEKHPKKEGA